MMAMASCRRHGIFLLFALALALLQQRCCDGARLGVGAQNRSDEVERKVKQYIRTRESIVR